MVRRIPERARRTGHDAYSAFLAEDVELFQNNAGPVTGRDAVHAGLEHDLLNIYGSDRNFVLEALNHYSRLDGEPVTLRAVAFTDRDEEGRASSVRFFTDTAPLFA